MSLLKKLHTDDDSCRRQHKSDGRLLVPEIPVIVQKTPIYFLITNKHKKYINFEPCPIRMDGSLLELYNMSNHVDHRMKLVLSLTIKLNYINLLIPFKILAEKKHVDDIPYAYINTNAGINCRMELCDWVDTGSFLILKFEIGKNKIGFESIPDNFFITFHGYIGRLEYYNKKHLHKNSCEIYTKINITWANDNIL